MAGQQHCTAADHRGGIIAEQLVHHGGGDRRQVVIHQLHRRSGQGAQNGTTGGIEQLQLEVFDTFNIQIVDDRQAHRGAGLTRQKSEGKIAGGNIARDRECARHDAQRGAHHPFYSVSAVDRYRGRRAFPQLQAGRR